MNLDTEEDSKDMEEANEDAEGSTSTTPFVSLVMNQDT